MPLRDYQTAAISAVQQNQSAGITKQLIVCPTGVGKMIIAANLPAAVLRPGQQLVFMAHRNELVAQAARQMEKFNPGLRVSIDRASQKADMNADIIVASIPTIGKDNSRDSDGFTERIKRYNPDRLGVVIVDECHIIGSNDLYLRPLHYFRAYKGDAEHCDPAKLLVGFTATPNRSDGIGLDTIFDKIVFSRDIREMISAHWLVDIIGYRVETSTDLTPVSFRHGDFAMGELERAVNTPERNAIIVSKYREVGGGKPAIAFTVDVAHAHDLAGEFRRAGISALPLSGHTPDAERERVLRGFEAKEIAVLCSCGVLTTGVDLPIAEIALMARPTSSSLLFRQAIGRVLRPYPAPEQGPPTKTTATVIDFVDLSYKHQLLTVPTLFGLRADFDLKGSRATAALGEIEAAEDSPAHVRPSSVRTLAELRSLMTCIDLLKPLVVSEAVRSLSRFAWIDSGTDSYRLSVPHGAVFVIHGNALGGYDLDALDNGHRRSIISVDTLETAFMKADALVPHDVRGLLLTNAGWRSDPPTDKQIQHLARIDRDMFRRFGSMELFRSYILSTFNKGELSTLISERTER